MMAIIIYSHDLTCNNSTVDQRKEMVSVLADSSTFLRNAPLPAYQAELLRQDLRSAELREDIRGDSG